MVYHSSRPVFHNYRSSSNHFKSVIIRGKPIRKILQFSSMLAWMTKDCSMDIKESLEIMPKYFLLLLEWIYLLSNIDRLCSLQGLRTSVDCNDGKTKTKLLQTYVLALIPILLVCAGYKHLSEVFDYNNDMSKNFLDGCYCVI